MPASTALWITDRETAELKPAAYEIGDGLLGIETLFSGISRGTESLVFRGQVPPTEWQRMRCPLQAGDFPFPVKYGYAAVGVVTDGEPDLLGKQVFVLHPHQRRFSAPAGMAVPLPHDVPPSRAILAANMETALNVVWDSGAGAGDRIAIVGAGVVGALVGYLCAKMPGAEVTLVDVNEERSKLAGTFGCDFASPDSAPADCDVVIHTSASAAGLATALSVAGMEARIVEASWYGAKDIAIPLGQAFHSKRLQLVSSQVGQVPTDRRARWTFRRRLEKAIAVLADERLDVLISGETEFDDLPARYGPVLADPATLCHRIRYSHE